MHECFRQNKIKIFGCKKGFKIFFFTSALCLSLSLLPSSFVVYKQRIKNIYISSLSVLFVASFFLCCLSSCTQRRHFSSEALVHCCFLVFRPIGEYISLDLFHFNTHTHAHTYTHTRTHTHTHTYTHTHTHHTLNGSALNYAPFSQTV